MHNPIHTDHPKILVGIVTYNSSKHITQCLEYLMSQKLAPYRIIVIDNASSDNTLEVLNNFIHPIIEIWPQKSNLGFGNAHNRILASVEDWDFYCPLNPDCFLDPLFFYEAFATFQHFSSNTPYLGAINGLTLFYKNGHFSDQIFSRGHQFYQERRTESLDIGRDRTTLLLDDELIYGPNGACPLFSRAMYNALQFENGALFEPLFFMYSEDEDLCWRMKKAGWQTAFSHQAIAWHIGGGSHPTLFRSVRSDSIANRYLTIIRNDRIIDFIRDFPIILFVEICFIVLNSIRRPRFLIDYFCAIKKVVRHCVYMRKRTTPLAQSVTRADLYAKFDLKRFKSLFFRHSKRTNPFSIHSKD